MNFKKFGSKYVIRIDKGEEIIQCLGKFCKETGTRLASVSGIGASDKIVLGIFESSTKMYHKKEFKGDYEITSLTGNISTLEAAPLVHIHINLSGLDCLTVGGHLHSALISVTCEIIVDVLEGDASRIFHKETGANILNM